MKLKHLLYSSVAVIGVAAFAAAVTAPGRAQQPAVAIDNDDIGGVVRGAGGPEAGVWVIAETTDLPTKFAKIVVTDDQGRYVIPDLPKAKYKVWVRGYGLVDSPKLDGEPGQQLNLTAVVAPNDAAAAQYYPAIYWYSMLKDPGPGSVRRQEQHPGETHPDRLAQAGQEHRLHRLPSARPGSDAHNSRRLRRVQDRRGGMDAANRSPGNPASRWPTSSPGISAERRTSISAIGPTASPRASCRKRKPSRPQGAERNVVVTSWEWGYREAISARPHLLRSAQPDRQCLWAALRLAGIRDRQHADPGSEGGQGDVLQDAGARSQHAGIARARSCREHAAAAAIRLLGRGEDLGYQGQQPQRHVRQERAAYGLRPRCAAWTIPLSARRDRSTPRPRCSRSTSRRGR